MSIGKKTKNDFIYIFVRVLIFSVRLLPRSLSLMFARILASCLWNIFNKERRKTLAHLETAFGSSMSEPEKILTGKRVFANIAQNLVDAVLLKKLLGNNPELAMEIEGIDIAKASLAKGKGIVFLTAHTGCFEMLSPRFSQIGFPVTVMGAKIYDHRLNDLIVSNRKNFDVDYLERGSDIRSLIRLLREGKCFGVLCDLDTRVESRFIPFFGKNAKTASGPFRLALKTGAAPVPVFTTRLENGKQLAKVFPELLPSGNSDEEKLISIMTSYNQLLEDIIKEDPTQWIWMHERWRSKE